MTTTVPPFRYDTPYRSHHLRAAGGLTYLEFIKAVDYLWGESHPDIPFFAMSGKQLERMPAIIYHLQMRKPHPQEPKLKYREEIITPPDQDAMHLYGQRFQNIVNFTVVTENDPETAELIIEVFEDFMLEMTPHFKEVGVSELVYARRLPDSEETKTGEDEVRRTVAYLVTLEKVIPLSAKKLNDSLKKLKTFVVHLRMPAVQERPHFMAHAGTNTISVYGMSLLEGDFITLYPEQSRLGEPLELDLFPGGLISGGTYYVTDIQEDVQGRAYLISLTLGGLPIDITSDGAGYIAQAPEDTSDNINIDIQDDFRTPA